MAVFVDSAFCVEMGGGFFSLVAGACRRFDDEKKTKEWPLVLFLLRAQ